MDEKPPITLLLRRIRTGDTKAVGELFELIYPELRRLAGGLLRRERPGHTLQPTALVNEAYVRMLGSLDVDWTDRSHFFAISARVMRHILVDYARARNSIRRSGNDMPELDEPFVMSDEKLDTIIRVDLALSRLEKIDARQARIVDLRFFAGLTEEEIALGLGISARTVKRDWTVAKAWLRAELESGSQASPATA